jgi:hypothetical protein
VIAFHDACNDIAMAGPETWRQNFKPCALLIEHSQSRLNIYQESETAQ